MSPGIQLAGIIMGESVIILCIIMHSLFLSLVFSLSLSLVLNFFPSFSVFHFVTFEVATC
jgi:hypothetical protein